jgi:hypothetical protein
VNVNELEKLVFDASLPERERLEAALSLLGAVYCPFDCDSCHSDDCPCDRLGCAGNPL